VAPSEPVCIIAVDDVMGWCGSEEGVCNDEGNDGGGEGFHACGEFLLLFGMFFCSAAWSIEIATRGV
jgi:hypothetical protein